MKFDENYANLQRCCGGEVTTETLWRFRLAMIEYDAYCGQLRLWMVGEVDPQTGTQAEDPPLPADLLHKSRSGHARDPD